MNLLGGSVVCIGVFDGVHRGHRAVLARGRAAADELGLPLVVLTFDPHPMEVLRPSAAPKMLSTIQARTELLRSAGVDHVHILRFDKEIASLTPRTFVEECLVAELAARSVLVGANFRFGHRAAGDVVQLAALGREYDFTTTALDLVDDGSGQVWSSSEIRQLVSVGDVAAATEGLTRPHRVEGPVVVGDRRGRELGYPTANLEAGLRQAVPAESVYAARLLRNPYGAGSGPAEVLPAAVSVGVNRTFNGVDPRVEAFVIDASADLDLYGEHVALDFIARLRPMEHFESVDDLVSRMAVDVEEARRVLG